MEETLRQTSAALVHARASRDKYNARVRRLERGIEAARQHADSIAAEQAAKTAALRDEAVVVRRQLTDAAAVQKELAAASEAATDAEKVAAYRQRLAEGNAAYGQLTAQYEGLSKSLEDHKTRTKADARIQHDWDRLCRRLYQVTKGRPSTEADTEILTRWINRKNEQHQQKQNEQARKKAGTK